MPLMMREEMRQELIRAAAEGRTLTYGYLMRKFGLSRGRQSGETVVGTLGEVDRYETSRGAPGFAAIVVRQDTGFPGGGFFCWSDIPANLRRPNNLGQNPRLSDAEKKYVRTQQERIWSYYKNHFSIEAHLWK